MAINTPRIAKNAFSWVKGYDHGAQKAIAQSTNSKIEKSDTKLAMKPVAAMELPYALKMKLRVLDVLPWPNKNGYPLHFIPIFVMYFFLIDSVVFTIWSLLWEIDTFSDFAQTFLCMIVIIFYTMIYSRVIWQRKQFALIIEDVEHRINSSKFDFSLK